MNLIEETRWSIERAKEAARAVFAIPEAEKISESLDRCLEAYREKHGEPEKPLTLEQLMQMDGNPVWIRDLTENPFDDCYYALVCMNYNPQEFQEYDFSEGVAISIPTNKKSAVAIALIRDYGETWIAYAHKPEGSAP